MTVFSKGVRNRKRDTTYSITLQQSFDRLIFTNLTFQGLIILLGILLGYTMYSMMQTASVHSPGQGYDTKSTKAVHITPTKTMQKQVKGGLYLYYSFSALPKVTSYCSLKPLWSGMGEVVPARTSPTLHPPIPSHCASIVVTSTVRVKRVCTCLFCISFSLFSLFTSVHLFFSSCI